MNDALNILRVNLKNFNWNANSHYKIDKNEAKGILEVLEKEHEKQNRLMEENKNGRS